MTCVKKYEQQLAAAQKKIAELEAERDAFNRLLRESEPVKADALNRMAIAEARVRELEATVDIAHSIEEREDELLKRAEAAKDQLQQSEEALQQVQAEHVQLQRACAVFQKHSEELTEVYEVLYRAGLIPRGKPGPRLAEIVKRLVVDDVMSGPDAPAPPRSDT